MDNFVLVNGKPQLGQEQKKEQFREFLLSRNFRLDMITPFKEFTGISKVILDGYMLKQNLFIFGENASCTFYTYMAEVMRRDRNTIIYSSSDLVRMAMEHSAELNYRHIGVVLGYDLTNSIQEKVMPSFLFDRLGLKGCTTTFMYPQKSMRKLESEYKDVFHEMFKADKLKKLEV